MLSFAVLLQNYKKNLCLKEGSVPGSHLDSVLIVLNENKTVPLFQIWAALSKIITRFRPTCAVKNVV